jgi:hypothetical protein
MASFQVFVEGPADPSPGGLEKLAAAMESRYGLAAAELVVRMQKGRFRVKANIDRATADAYLRDLTKIGAKARVEEMGSAAASSVLPSAPKGTTTPPQLSSGLSAAFSGNIPVANLGALESSQLSLSALDGSEDAIMPPPSQMMPASIGPAPERPARDSHISLPPPTKPTVSDRFLPPEAQGEEAVLELAAPMAPSTPVLRPRASVAPVNVTFDPGATAIEAPPRWKYAVGVLIAIVLGFVPAHFVGAMRESAVYARIDKNLVAAQSAAISPEDFDALDGLRAHALDEKRSARRIIMLQAMLVWALAGGAIGYGWSRLNRPRAKGA